MKFQKRQPKKSFSTFKRQDRIVDISHQDQFIFNRTPILASALQRLKKHQSKPKNNKRPPTQTVLSEEKVTKKVKISRNIKQQPHLTYTPLQRDLFTFYTINKATIKSGETVPEPKFEIGSLVLTALADRGIGGKYLVTNLFRNKKGYIDFKQVSQVNDPLGIEIYTGPGEYVVCSVIKGMNVKTIQLSMKQFIEVEEKSLRIGECLAAEVKSKQEVGCHLIVKNCKYRFYLAKEDIEEQQFNQIEEKKQVLITIKEIKKESHLAKVVLAQDKLFLNLKGVEQQDMDKLQLQQYVTPGTLVNTKIVKIVKNGLLVKFLKIFVGYIHVDHLARRLDSYVVDEKIPARIIYYCVNPPVIYLSEKHIQLAKYQPQRQLYTSMNKPQELQDQQGSYFNKKQQFFLHPLQMHSELANLTKFWVKENNYFQHYQIMCSKKLGLRVGQISKVVPFTNFKVFGKGEGKFRVMCLDVWNKIVKLSYHPKLLQAQNLLMDITQYDPQIKYTGFITSVNANGAIIQFCNNIKGIITKHELNSQGIELNESNLGEGIQVYIVNTKKGLIGVSLMPGNIRKSKSSQVNRKKSEDINSEQTSVGTIVSINLKSINPIYIKLKSKIIKISVFKGIVAACPTQIETIRNLASKFEVGERVKVFRKAKQYFLYPPEQLSDKQLKICKVLGVQANYVRLQIAKDQFRNCHITDITDLIVPYPFAQLEIGSYQLGRELPNGFICLRSSIVNNGIPKNMKQYKEQYQQNQQRGDYRNRILTAGSASLHNDITLFGYIKSYSDKGCFVSVTADYQIRIQMCQLTDQYIMDKAQKFQINKLLFCRLISQKIKPNDPNIRLFDASARESVVKHGYPLNQQILMTGLTVNGIVTGYAKGKALVKLNSSRFTAIISPKDVQGSDQQLPLEKVLKLGTVLKCKIIQYENDNGRKLIRLSTLNKHFEKFKGVELDLHNEPRINNLWVTYKEMQKIEPPQIQTEILNQNEDEDQYQRINRLLGEAAQSQPMDEEQPEGQSKQEMDVENQHNNNSEDQQQSNDDSSEQQEKNEQKKVRQNVQNVSKIVSQFEKMPHPPSFYQSLVLTNPSSQSHLMYISSLLPTSTPEEIRAQFVRAINKLTTIKDKDNMWISWLNMELILGGFMQTVKKALQSGVGVNVHFRIIQILIEQEKWSVALQFSKKMLKKFNKDPKAYSHFIKTAILYSGVHNLPERLTPQQIIRRAKQCLTSAEVIIIQSHYGKTLFELKENQKARNIFQEIVTKYPQRTDLWNMYTDLQIKHGEVDKARSILERALTIGLKRQKVMSILKKYHHIELNYGTSETVAAILARAKSIAELYQHKHQQSQQDDDQQSD